MRVVRVSKRELLDRAGGAARDCVLEIPSTALNRTVSLLDLVAPVDSQESLIVMLDHVTDPHNLGAVLRSADQFGVDGVVLPDRRAADITPVVVKTSSGASAYVPVARVKNLATAARELKDHGYWIYGADMSGERADTANLTGRIAVILGSEGSGLSQLLRERSDGLVSLPTAGHVDSLNVSVAAGILMYEIRRQQKWFD